MLRRLASCCPRTPTDCLRHPAEPRRRAGNTRDRDKINPRHILQKLCWHSFVLPSVSSPVPTPTPVPLFGAINDPKIKVMFHISSASIAGHVMKRVETTESLQCPDSQKRFEFFLILFGASRQQVKSRQQQFFVLAPREKANFVISAFQVGPGAAQRPTG